MKISSHYSWTVPMRRYCQTQQSYGPKTKPQKNTSFKVNCTFVTTSLIFPQAYKSMHTHAHAHTHCAMCFKQNEWGGLVVVFNMYRLLLQYRQVSVCVSLSFYARCTDSTAQYDWKKGNKMFWLLYSVLPGQTFVFNDTRMCGWVRSESYRVICH